jgi:hypothetical protein
MFFGKILDRERLHTGTYHVRIEDEEDNEDSKSTSSSVVYRSAKGKGVYTTQWVNSLEEPDDDTLWGLVNWNPDLVGCAAKEEVVLGDCAEVDKTKWQEGLDVMGMEDYHAPVPSTRAHLLYPLL